MNKKKAILSICAVVLVCVISVMGTMSYLTAKQDGDKAVVNTFVAVQSIIDDKPTSVDAFKLVESKATMSDGAYVLGTDEVTSNTYDKAVPNMVIPKDPKLSVNVATGVSVYVFVKVTDTTGSNLAEKSLTSDWTQVTISGLSANETVYVYKNAAVVGADGMDLNSVAILANNQVKTALDFTDVDTAADGLQLGELKFEAYVCQATGFDSAAAAFTACFVS